MKTEELIVHIAEIKAAQSATNFMLMTFLEHSGCDPESLIRAVDQLLLETANAIEDKMRRSSGLPPREKPRLSALDAVNPGLQVDWERMPKN